MTEEQRELVIKRMRKMLTILKLAIAKIHLAMEQPGADRNRLGKIVTKLEGTSAYCGKALDGLLDGVAKDPSPITPGEIADVDWNNLLKKLQ